MLKISLFVPFVAVELNLELNTQIWFKRKQNCKIPYAIQIYIFNTFQNEFTLSIPFNNFALFSNLYHIKSHHFANIPFKNVQRSIQAVLNSKWLEKTRCLKLLTGVNATIIHSLCSLYVYVWSNFGGSQVNAQRKPSQRRCGKREKKNGFFTTRKRCTTKRFNMHVLCIHFFFFQYLYSHIRLF